MSIFKSFFSARSKGEIPQELSSVYQRFEQELPELEGKDCMTLACLCALLARVAFVDMKITGDEISTMVQAITDSTQYSQQVAQKMVSIASEEISDLVDLENQLYIRPLNELLDPMEKGKILKLLFKVAASDEKVENLESEEIRRISKELRVSHQQFVEAKLTVKNQIEALKR